MLGGWLGEGQAGWGGWKGGWVGVYHRDSNTKSGRRMGKVLSI